MQLNLTTLVVVLLGWVAVLPTQQVQGRLYDSLLSSLYGKHNGKKSKKSEDSIDSDEFLTLSIQELQSPAGLRHSDGKSLLAVLLRPHDVRANRILKNTKSIHTVILCFFYRY